MSNDYPSCAERIGEEYRSAMDDLRHALQVKNICQNPKCRHEWYSDDEDDECPECMSLGEDGEEFFGVDHEDGMSEYMENMLELTKKYIVVDVKMSWGGPEDGFTLYVDPEDYTIERAEYYFRDWFDGATRRVEDSDLELVCQMFESEIELLRES